jgi:hypothetical protein
MRPCPDCVGRGHHQLHHTSGLPFLGGQCERCEGTGEIETLEHGRWCQMPLSPGGCRSPAVYEVTGSVFRFLCHGCAYSLARD